MKEIKAKTLFDEINSSSPPFVLDVREIDEWQSGHIKQAHHIPMGLVCQKESSLPQNQKIVVVCRSGYRSCAAALQLEKSGFQDVVNLSGGMISWTDHGLPLSQRRH